MKGEAEEAKEQGNKCMKEKKYAEALLHYSNAIRLQPNDETLYSNRSLAFKYMDQYHYAIDDAKKTITLNPTWAKGYYRLGEVQFATEHYKDALWSYKQALNFSRDDETLKQSVIKARQHLDQQTKAEKRMPTWGILAGGLLGLCIVISDLVLAKNPVLNHVVFQVLIILAVAAIGYVASLSYRYFLRMQRATLLEPPVDLFGDQEASTSEDRNTDMDDKKSDSKPRKRRSAAAARHQARQSKT